MSPVPRRALAAVLALSALAVVAGCAAPPAAAPTPSASTAEPLPVVTPTVEPSPSATPVGDATCESILPADTVADFEGIGWTAKEEPFHVGDTQLIDGLQCTWGDFAVATDHVQIFGWAPITDAQATTAQQELLSTGWRREDSEDGVYITESLDTAIAPVDGYGITYLFQDGSVTVADTKQGLLLVEPPQS
ncbi:MULTISPECIES: hypothetical protein [unclassified Microbacterium]|uniref:hypothetical protein n=1 Tax=unclassified Microbacterium TaxID=2609290 RepID=UPI0037469689